MCVGVSCFAGCWCCATDADCQLNGECLQGLCVCDPAWGKADCSELQLLPSPAAPAYPPPKLFNVTSSWGGSVVRDDDGKYHMFVSEFAEDCGLKSWATNSMIVHAVADAPQGPFQRIGVVVDAFAHNPVVARAPDGWVLWHIGCGSPNRGTPKCSPCANGTTNTSACKLIPEEVSCSSNSTHVLHTSSLDGPWESINASIANPSHAKFLIDNPAPYIRPDGSVLMLGRDGGSTCRSITAPSWNGPYTLGPMIGDKDVPVEDPFLYQDTRGAFHALFHGGKQGGGVVNAGYHWFSADGLTWNASSKTAYTTIVNNIDGTTTRYNRRERPHMIFDHTGAPTHLYTGVWLGIGDKSATHVQQIQTAAHRSFVAV